MHAVALRSILTELYCWYSIVSDGLFLSLFTNNLLVSVLHAHSFGSRPALLNFH